MTLVIFLLLLSVLMNSIGQVSLKHGMVALQEITLRDLPKPGSIRRFVMNPAIVIWFFLLLITMVLWLKAISMAELSFAYPFQSLNMVFISLGSIIFLKERITGRQWLGNILILLGICFISIT